MQTSLLLAQVMGPISLIVGLGMAFNRNHYKKAIMKFTKNDGLMYTGAMMALIVGLVIIQAHNVWEKDWTLMITLIAWVIFAKGVLLIIAPSFMNKQMKACMERGLINTAVVLALALGIALSYFGFYA